MITKLSCGIVVYDEVSDIQRLTGRLQAELMDYQVEWVFILNHEQAEIRCWIKNWILKNITQSVCIENPSNNLGFARQLILQTATEDYVYMTDPDVEIKNGSLVKLIQLADSESLIDKNLKCIGFGGTLIYRSTHLFLQKTFDFIFKVARQTPFAFQIQHHAHLATVDHIPSCHLLLKRRMALELGGFSLQFSKVGEDLDFSHRCYNQGFNFIFSPDSEAFHFQNLTLGKWLYRVFSFGQVQITVQKIHFRNGLRYYRLLPSVVFAVLVFFSFQYPEMALVLAFTSLLAGFIFPGFLGFLLTALTYSLGEISETIYPTLEIKNAPQLQVEKLYLETLIERTKIEIELG